jgi:HSP20 family protein
MPLDANRQVLVVERPRGAFSRQPCPGDTFDADRIVANYRGGVMRLEIPVAEQAKPKKVAIQIESSEQTAITV